MQRGEIAVANSCSLTAFREIQGSPLKVHGNQASYGYCGERPHRQRTNTNQPRTQGAILPPPPPPPPIYQRYSAMNCCDTKDGPASEPLPRSNRSYGCGKRGSKHHPNNNPDSTPRVPFSTRGTEDDGANQSHISGHGRLKTMRSACVSFLSRGKCQYGTNCKFSHAAEDAPTSNRHVAPRTDARNPWAITGQQFHVRDAPTSQALSGAPARPGSQYGHSNDGSPKSQSHSRSPSKKLAFRDAVLNQHSISSNAMRCATFSPSTNQAIPSESKDCNAPRDKSKVSVPTSQRSYRSRGGRIYPSDNPQQTSPIGYSMRHTQYAPEALDNNYGHRTNQVQEIVQAEHAKSINHCQAYHAQQLTDPTVMQAGYLVHPAFSSSQDQGYGMGGAFGFLSRQANDFVEALDSKLESLEVYQQNAVTKLQNLVSGVWWDAAIDVYGSKYTHLALPTSDVDCVLVSQALTGDEPVTVLRQLADEIRQQHWARSVELLDGAKIPVLKIVTEGSPAGEDILLDLTCGHSVGHSGLIARDLIYSHQTQMPALRPLVLILKSHLQHCDLNCAFTGGLSSYALVLMAIRFLQACGDEHYRSYDRVVEDVNLAIPRSRSYSEGVLPNFSRGRNDSNGVRAKWSYVFARDGKITWRTGMGNLLLLFLETYISFDYRRYGISIEDAGEYFPLPLDKISLEAGSVVSPYIVDPIKSGRCIGNCFRMHEVVQAWYTLYQQLAIGVSLDIAVQPQRHGPA